MDRMHALTLGDLLRENRRSYPQRTAAVCGAVRLTYPELDERVSRLANALAAERVGTGDRVLWLAQNCHRLLEVLLAAAKLGAILCPVNWRGSAAEFAFVIDDLRPKIVFWQEEEIGERVRAARGAAATHALWIRHDLASDEGYEAFLARGTPDDPEVEVDPSSPVLALYTAAFGGRPNAALVSHWGFILQDLAIGLLQRASCDTVYLNSGPLFHVGSFMTTMVAFHFGGTNVFMPRFDPEEFCRLAERERCTAAYVVGPMMERILEANRDRRFDLRSLRTAPGPEAWSAMVTVERTPWTEDPGGYGQTEVTGIVTFKSLGGRGEGSHGRTLPVAQVRIVDSDGHELPPGEVGEIVVRGPTAMVGYHDRPEENAIRRRGDWHHTRDLGRREADGSITFVGPMTTMIKSGVENIYPAEVEAAVASHPAVAAVCVIGVPDPKWQQAVKAVVVLRSDQQATADEIIEHCRTRIASYKKPRLVEFADALPRDAVGQIDRAAVDARFGGGGYPGPTRTKG